MSTILAIKDNQFFLSLMQDLDAALPIIEKYKDHLVAIGEVSFSIFDVT